MIKFNKELLQQWVNSFTFALVAAIVLRSFIFGLYHVPTGSAEPNILVGDRMWGNKLAYWYSEVKRGDLAIFDNPEHIYDHSNIIKYWWQKHVGFPIPLLSLESGPDNWVKRVVGLPGDIIEGKIEDDKTVVYLNGKRLDEPYVNIHPLIRLRKTTGFFDTKWAPSFLRKHTRDVSYTYDATKPYEEQPYYRFVEQDVIKTAVSNNVVLLHPQTPTFAVSQKSSNGMCCVDSFGPLEIPSDMCWVMGDSRKNSRDSRYWGLLPMKLIRARASVVLYSIDSEESWWFFDFVKNPVQFWTKNVRWNRLFKKLDHGYIA